MKDGSCCGSNALGKVGRRGEGADGMAHRRFVSKDSASMHHALVPHAERSWL